MNVFNLNKNPRTRNIGEKLNFQVFKATTFKHIYPLHKIRVFSFLFFFLFKDDVFYALLSERFSLKQSVLEPDFTEKYSFWLRFAL